MNQTHDITSIRAVLRAIRKIQGDIDSAGEFVPLELIGRYNNLIACLIHDVTKILGERAGDSPDK